MLILVLPHDRADETDETGYVRVASHDHPTMWDRIDAEAVEVDNGSITVCELSSTNRDGFLFAPNLHRNQALKLVAIASSRHSYLDTTIIGDPRHIDGIDKPLDRHEDTLQGRRGQVLDVFFGDVAHKPDLHMIEAFIDELYGDFARSCGELDAW